MAFGGQGGIAIATAKAYDEKTTGNRTSHRRPGTALVSAAPAGENADMEIPGHVQDGVVVLEGAPGLPEGAKVTVCYHAPTEAGGQSRKRRIELPLVRTGEPGSVHLTAQRIAEILDEEDVSPRR